MGDVENFVPRPDTSSVSAEAFEIALANMRPDLTEDQIQGHMEMFFAMKERVEWPCRRIGTPVTRAGPVLFDPVQYIVRDLPE